MEIIRFCNENEGFMSAILAIVSIALSVVALSVSIRIGRQQNQIALLEKRVNVYQEIVKMYNVCKNYAKRAGSASYMARLSMASMFLHTVNSKEARICEKLYKLQRKENRMQDESKRKRLKKQWLETSDKLVDYAIGKTELADKLRSEIHLFYTENIERLAIDIIDTYEWFAIGFFGMDQEQLDEIIGKMSAIVKEAERVGFIDKLEKQTLNKKNM